MTRGSHGYTLWDVEPVLKIDMLELLNRYGFPAIFCVFLAFSVMKKLARIEMFLRRISVAQARILGMAEVDLDDSDDGQPERSLTPVTSPIRPRRKD